MRSSGSGRSAITIVEETLSIPRYRGRLRHLSARQREFSDGVWHELVARAHVFASAWPEEAAQCARLAEVVAAGTDGIDTLARICMMHGRYPATRRALDAAFEIARREGPGERLGEPRILRPLTARAGGGDMEAIARRSLELFELAGDRDGMIRIRLALGDLALDAQRARDALPHYAEAERLAGDGAATYLRGVIACNLACALVARARFRAARRHFERARALFLADGDESAVAKIDYNVAYASARHGRYEAALRRYAAVQAIFRRLRDERLLAFVDLDRAAIHVKRRMPDEASTMARRAEGRFFDLGMEIEAALAAQQAGRAAELRGDLHEAERCLRRAGEIFRGRGAHDREFFCLVQRGFLAARGGRRSEARHLAEEAAALLGDDEGPLAAASVDLLRARLDIIEGNATRAAARARAVREECAPIHAPWIVIEAWRIEGQALAAQNRLDDAIGPYLRAIATLERHHGGFPPSDCVALFLSGRGRLYAEMVALLADAGRARQAFEFAERAHARAVVDLVATRPKGGLPLVRDRCAARRIHRLRLRLDTLYRRLAREALGVGSAPPGARAEARDKERRLDGLLERLRTADAEAVSLEAVDAPDLDEVQASLEPGTRLLQYLVADHEIFIFVVSRDGLHVARQDVAATDLQRLLERLRYHLTRVELNTQDEDLLLQSTCSNLSKLANLLLAPVAEQLDGSRVVVVPHGPLMHLPFHALPWGQAYLADRFEIVYCPTAAVYGFGADKGARAGRPASILSLTDCSTPAVEHEAERTAAALPDARRFGGEQATRARFEEEARGSGVLHVATDRISMREEPLRASLRLADTWLTLADLFTTEIGAALAVVSTFEEGVPEVTGGEEILGTSRAILYAGARALLVNHWRVNDDTTAEFMALFYRHLRAGRGPARAWSIAMAAIRVHKPHPYYWASFHLSGRPDCEDER